jgi:decaprenyl-phosphate phosphoribosyltransferase
VALVVAARPKQWVKNVLVFAAPGAAAVLTHGPKLVEAIIAFVAFCLAASGTYYLNDARDVEADRQHPTKRNRPIAAGEVSVPLAQVIGAVLILAGIGVSFAAYWELAVVVGSYVIVTTLYTLWLKHEVLFDVVAVAAGFVLRAIGGAAATHVEVSNWFFIVATFGSLFMVSCKRHAEARTMGEDAHRTRAVLDEYSESYLSYLRAVCSGVVLVAYCLWAFEKAAVAASHVPLFQLSVVPFGLAILRYALLVDQGHGGAPEEVIFGDRMLQVIGVCWAVLFALGLYFK